MTTEHSNPFVLPGFGQSGDSAQNPVFAGMEMMRKAWQSMAGAGVSGLESAGIPVTSIEDLERRIGELQAVENWLRLNLSMLSNTIQGLEIQRSTMATLRSFAAQGVPGETTPKSASTGEASSSAPTGAPDTQPYAQAAENWWNLVQQQFQSLAAATAAQPATRPAARSAAKPAAKSAAKPASKPAAKSAANAAPKRPTRRPS